jgi:hypothetical protein
MPIRIKTTENPKTKADEFCIVTFLIAAVSPALKSSKETPVI